jgi:hypothetical protein
MHTYRKTENGYQVGYYINDYDFIEETAVSFSEWVAVSTHGTEHDALHRVNFLNGGSVSFNP